ncbi:protein CHUP1, chloroplastic isoform X2 [Jatropha curcas]|uniref:protein CHUP1, chloroplastic isoform X2 n=1 Tax=Jatropha curcas TaxID=180498 RepID=UPI0009D674D1|nr:protein CHUP1, chloroplastic isoform X2 [Jatropha curcas]
MKAEPERKKMPQEEDESLIIYLKKELESSLIRNDSLEKENRELRQEIIRLKAQITSLKAHDNERKSLLWKKLQNSNDSSQQIRPSEPPDNNPKLQLPNPPPKLTPIFNQNKLPPPISAAPPPPPPPSKMFMGSKSVRRVPEVVEFYRLLTRKNVSSENNKNHSTAATPVTAFSPNMIGEIENRSTHLSAIKSDVEKRKEFINYLIKEVESAAFKGISEVETFVQWLDNELSSLVDERAVLKHFTQWPERKADALREAACNYRDLRNLDVEVSLFEDNPKEPLNKSLGRIQAMQDRLERSVNNTERTRESIMKKYREFQIPWEWLLDTGLIGQMKLSSLRLAKAYMKRIIKELQANECSGSDNLLLQGARFAYRLHQVVLTQRPCTHFKN